MNPSHNAAIPSSGKPPRKATRRAPKPSLRLPIELTAKPLLPTETAVNLKKVSCDTELSIVQEGVPAAIPPEACYLGWQESLILLAKLVKLRFQTSSSVVGAKSEREARSLHPWKT